MKNNIAISVKNVSKTFVIPHEKISTLRGAFVSLPKALRLTKRENAFRSKSYENFKALNDISFEVRKGEFFGIIGRNGSGKSTLLKILAGIYAADKGNIKINGRISPFLELGIGFNPELSGRDNIYLNASVLGLTKRQIDKKFDDIVAFSELGRFIDQKVKNYSSGMSVRLAFSVAINANRDILLMDEVLAVGDTNFQGKCFEEFNKYRDQGKTVILVTHDIGTVQRYCDRAMLLRSGKIELIGDPEKVGNKYIYQNMSDEEKRLLNEEKRLRLKAEKEAREREKEVEKQRREEEKRQKTLTEQQKREEQEQREREKKERQAVAEKAREERKNKVAKITKVEFLDEDGKMKNVFKTGDVLNIQINYKIYKKIRGLNIGIGLYSETNERVFGYNTQMDNFKINKNSGFLNLRFDRLPILKGIYYLNVVCFGDAEQTCYDLKLKYKILRIFSSGLRSKYRGLIDIKHEWTS